MAENIIRVYEHCDVCWADTSGVSNADCPYCGKTIEPTAHIEVDDLLLLLKGPLVLKPGNEGNDYLLKDTHRSVWIETGNIVAYVRRVNAVDPNDESKTIPEGVAVDLVPTICAHETLDCCNADFDQAKEHECRECGEYNGWGEGFDGLCGNCADKAEEERNAKISRPE